MQIGAFFKACTFCIALENLHVKRWEMCRCKFLCY